MIAHLPLRTITFPDPKMMCTQNTLYDSNCSPDLCDQNKHLFLKIEQELPMLLSILKNSSQ